jgi:hypothetical protein
MLFKLTCFLSEFCLQYHGATRTHKKSVRWSVQFLGFKSEDFVAVDASR